MYALCDNNRFYASCHRIFRPDLRDKPIVVLSNNSGTCVTMTEEAEALGIKKFSPYFQIKDDCERLGVYVFGSTYELYGDISARVVNILASEAPDISEYSCDECFLDLNGFNGTDYRAFGQRLRKRLWKEVRMPACVGFGRTKTLAKLANHIAKKHPSANGVCCLDDAKQIERWLKRHEVGKVWGIGSQLTKKLRQEGIYTAHDLAMANPEFLRRKFSVVVERTSRELNGEPCLEFHESLANKKQIVVSRSFGKKVTTLKDLTEAVANYGCRAAEKLRKQGSLVKTVIVSAQSSLHEARYTRGQHVINLPRPTSDTSELLHYMNEAVRQIFKENVRYAKAMVAFVEIIDEANYQYDMLNGQSPAKNDQLMKVLDNLNRFNKNQVSFGRQGIVKQWSMKREFLSPLYTTQWSDIPKVK